MSGIHAYGVYLPRRRLQRSTIAEASVWFDAGLKGHAHGERTMCNWDEDVVTMCTEAARAVGELPPIDRIHMASTTFPFADRQNSGIVAEALALDNSVRPMDICGSLRAGTTALVASLEMSGGSLVVSADNRKARTGSIAEMQYGDGAVAVVTGEDDGIAKFLGAATVSADFIDHFRADGIAYDYDWEERWIRDEGYLNLIPQAVSSLQSKLYFPVGEYDYLILPIAQARVLPAVAKQLGINPDAIVDNLMRGCGHTGASHALLMLASVLEDAKPGEKILLIGFGQGCDAIALEVTQAHSLFRPVVGVESALTHRVEETNYAMYQTFAGLVEREFGKRAEVDRSPALSAHNRNRKMVNSFMGGRCTECGTVQFPKAYYCVSPNCGKGGSQEDFVMSTVSGKVKTYTADRLTFDMSPPAYFGLVEFQGGGRAMVDFSEVNAEKFDVGSLVRMAFRIKHVDERRGYKTYFWKAVPTD